jgi:hypothetical protein
MLFDITTNLVKDKILAQALRSFLNSQLDGLGAVSEMDFNSLGKNFTVTLAMLGEPRPVVVKIDSYSIQPGSAGSKFVIHEYSSSSHEWITGLARKFQPTFEFEIPVPYLLAKSLT